MTVVTLTYVTGMLGRKKIRRLMDKYECTYKETRGFFGSTFYVTADTDEHIKLALAVYCDD